MKIYNFKLIKTSGEFPDVITFGEVDVTTGCLWWKKTVKCKVCKKSGDLWFFVADGTYTPGLVVDYLHKAYEAQKVINE